MLISSTDTIKIKRTQEYESQTFEEKQAIFLQTIFVLKEIFINLDDIENFWQKGLHEKNINISTGIKYRHRDFSETLYGKIDSLFFKNSNRTNEYKTGVKNEITLQGFYELNFLDIIKHSNSKLIFYSWILSLIIMTLIITINISKK